MDNLPELQFDDLPELQFEENKTNQLQDIVQGIYRENYAPVMHGLSTLGFGLPKAIVGKVSPQAKEAIFPEQTSLGGKALRGVSEVGGALLGGGKFIKGAEAVAKAVPVVGSNALFRGIASGAMTGGAYSMADKISGNDTTMRNVMLGGATGAISPLMEGIRSTGKLGGHIINSLIKPSSRDKLFGKNPGQAIAKEGLVATSLEGLGKQVKSKITELGEMIKGVRTKPENIVKTVDTEGILNPINEVRMQLKKDPLTHRPVLKRIDKIVTDLTNGKGKIEKMSLESAYDLKYRIRDMQKWESATNADNSVDVALKKIYHNIDSSIDKAVPELQELNSRISNLISADQAIGNRLSWAQNQPAMLESWGGALNLPFQPLRSTALKTGMAKILTKGYKK